MQIIKYEVVNSILIIGYKDDSNSVVYTQLHYDPTKSKEELLQLGYQKCKSSIDYERIQDNPSIITELNGEDFIPQLPKPTKLDIDFNCLRGKVLNQYNELVSTDIDFSIEGTDRITIQNNKVIAQKIDKKTDYHIVAKYGELKEKHSCSILPQEEKLLKTKEEVQSEILLGLVLKEMDRNAKGSV